MESVATYVVVIPTVIYAKQQGLEPGHDKFEVNYRCDCSRERVENALISLGRAELEDLSKDGGTDVECHFCDKKYHFTPEEILGLIKE